MPGIPIQELPTWSTDKLREARKSQANRAAWSEIELVLEERKNDAEAAPRESETLDRKRLQEAILEIWTEVRKIEAKVERPKSEWRTWSLWVAVIALGWQIGEIIPWNSLLPTPTPVGAQKASKSIQQSPAHSAQLGKKSPNGPQSEAKAESSRPPAAKEPPLSKTPAETPKE